MSFGEQMRRRREELGLTRQQLAQRLGVSVSAVGNYETGVSAPKEVLVLRSELQKAANVNQDAAGTAPAPLVAELESALSGRGPAQSAPPCESTPEP